MTNKFQTISPIDNSIYLERGYSSDKDITDTILRAQKAQREWRNTSIAERANYCLKAVELLVAKKDELGAEITHQMGRPIQYTAGEIEGFAERARYMISIAENKLQDIPIDEQVGFDRYIKREPLGIVLSISPWNYPYLTAVNSIIPAIMAGNVVILKPSAQAPLTAERIKQAFDDAKLPEGVFQYLYLDHSSSQKLIQNEAINYVAFTGSVQGGLAVQHAAQKRFINIGLELGGKDAAYVREDAELEKVVPNLVDGAFFNSGQSCCGIERIYVHSTLYTEFVERAIDIAKDYILGNPLDKGTTLGPMVRAKAAEFARDQIKEAVAGGAKACIDNVLFKQDKAGTSYMGPQIMIDVDHSMRIMSEESFAPLVGIMSVDSDGAAIEKINESEFGLTASVWTNDLESAVKIGDNINAGTFFMNRCDYLDPALAWSGFKNSGRGCTLSEVGYEQLTRPKSFHLRRSL